MEKEKLNESNKLDEAQKKENEEVKEIVIKLISNHLSELTGIARKELECMIRNKTTGKKYFCKFSYEEIESEGENDGE